MFELRIQAAIPLDGDSTFTPFASEAWGWSPSAGATAGSDPAFLTQLQFMF